MTVNVKLQNVGDTNQGEDFKNLFVALPGRAELYEQEKRGTHALFQPTVVVLIVALIQHWCRFRVHG